MTATSVVFEIDLRVKLTQWLNSLQALTTFHLAPWAIGSLRYEVFRDGHVEIACGASLIPSINLYSDWACVDCGGMLLNTAQEVDGFINGGNCLDAPVYALPVFTT
jgi:hypothetical protein